MTIENGLQNLEFNIIERNFPYEILLLADETKESINKYVFDSQVYAVSMNGINIAAFCLLSVDEGTVEIKNIAVIKDFRNRGVGSEIIRFIRDVCKKSNSSLIVATAAEGIDQIRFYERNGFEKFDTIKNYFLDQYPDPIYERGVLLVDLVLLKFRES